MIQTLNTVVVEFVEMAIAYPNLPLKIISRFSCSLTFWIVGHFSWYYPLIIFSFPVLSYFTYHQRLGEKIVHHNLEESCYVVKERTDSICSLSVFLSRYPPSGKHVWRAYWNESGWAGILRVWHTRKGKAPGRIGTLYAGFTHSIHVSENTLGA